MSRKVQKQESPAPLEEYGEVLARAEEEPENENLGKRSTEEYNYMQTGRYKSQLQISLNVRKEGARLVSNNQIVIERVEKGYLSGSNEFGCIFYGTGTQKAGGRSMKFPIEVIMSRDRVIRVSCNCPECAMTSWYYSNSNKKKYCAYVSGFMDLITDYLKSHHLGDATDVHGSRLLQAYQTKRQAGIISKNRGQGQSLTLEPRLIRKNGKLGLSFRVGDGKLFVIKDLLHFVHCVKNAITEAYGSNTMINHAVQNFNEESRNWLHFIMETADEEERIRERINEETFRSGKTGKMDKISLYGWRLDHLFDALSGQSISYENRDTKIKCNLSTEIKNPKLVMSITADTEKNIFQGICVTMQTPYLYHGTGNAYYLDEKEGKFRKLDKEFYEKLEPILNQSNYGNVRFLVGRDHLSYFYYQILPEIEPYLTVVEKDTELIEQYLAPKVQFSFYLDAPGHDATCRVTAEYKEQKVSVLDLMRDEGKNLERFRQISEEQEVLYELEKLFSVADLENDCLSCGGDEDAVYTIVSEGVEMLAELGNVYCTRRFKLVNTPKKPSVSVGVNVSDGLLNLEIHTEDLSEQDLLDLLKNYRHHQRYYRFRSGEFADLQEDSLHMLFEMMEGMHLSPKDFVKGKMHLPLYRALYLDKMLEEHEEVYNTRDQVFRELIKNMKSVNDSDFEVPDSLQKTMRKYQKNGFRWLKTLEACHFGGILADDMGLGKTLQVISVLLSAKEEGQVGTSLVVSPASLVYNWGEEFEKFAPSLKVTLISGKQEERSSMIEHYAESDVLVTSYDLLKRDIDQYEGKQFDYEIIDEAQYIKNQTTAASKAVKLIQAKTRFALTGTPIENRLSELWSIFDYLMPGFLYGYETFRKEFETPIVKNNDEDALKRLQKMVNPFILRRLKTDVLKDLPDKLEETRVVRFEPEQQRLYDAQVVNMKRKLSSGSEADFNREKLQILAELTRLRQVCCDPHLCYDNYRGESAKLSSCLELIDSAISSGHKILLFSQFTSMLEIIGQRLEENKIRFYRITGDTPKKERLSLVKQFNEDDTPVFLISLKAGGVGLNLTGADVVIHYDPWWNLAAQNQATDRAHRIGQKRKVTVYKMIVKGTIEEKILKMQESKRDLAESVISGDNTGMGGLSREELMELLEIG